MPTFNEVIREMMRLRDPRMYPIYSVRGFKTQISPGTKIVMYRAEVWGEEGEYPVYIQFRDVIFTDDENKPGTIPYEEKDRTGQSQLKFYVVPELSKNNVALKCMCFTGDTLIPLVYGYSVPIKDLVDREYFYVYSLDLSTNSVVVGKGYNCELKKEKSSLVGVILNNNYRIRCTSDHKFLLKNGVWKEAKELVYGDCLQSLETNSHKVLSVDYLEEKEDVYCFTVEKYGNFFISVDNGKNLGSGVLVQNCSDFRFVWEYPLYRQKALIGQFRRYVRPPLARKVMPPKNPENFMGVCKHLWSFVRSLQEAKLVK